ncbi:MAG: hypothetical protein SPD96_01920 [Paludibacteraceae bacterium]|nr:hypothetical protein [Paludibacteraceae bacterium]
MKKLFSFVCALVCAMLLSAKTVYLDVSPIDWDGGNAKIAAWVWTGDGQGSWAGGTFLSKNADGYYTAEVGENKKVIFLRLNKDITDILKGWDNVWNRTNNLDIPADGKNVFKLTTWKVSNDNSNSDGYWLNYEPLVYTVVGAEAILGSAWSTTDTNNDMAKQEDGTFKLEKTGVLLNAGNYDYKIVDNHAWEHKLMENQTLTVETAGYHTLTFTYNASTNEVGATATLTQEEEVDPVIQLKGEFDNNNVDEWVVKDLALAADKKTASTTLILTARTIEMGILLDGNWNSNGKEIKPSSNTITLTETGEGNIKLYAPEYGEYTFTYTLESKTLVVTFPEGATDPLPVLNLFGSWDEWKAGTLFTPAADKLTATATLTLDAGDYTFKVTKDAAWMTNENCTENDSTIMTRGNSTDWTFVEGASKKHTGLKADAKGDYTFTWTYETNALSVTFPAATATDLIGADSDSKAVKIVRDGQLLIVRDGVTYNMMGSVVK